MHRYAFPEALYVYPYKDLVGKVRVFRDEPLDKLRDLLRFKSELRFWIKIAFFRADMYDLEDICRVYRIVRSDITEQKRLLNQTF
jgi:hypothetical protein